MPALRHRRSDSVRAPIGLIFLGVALADACDAEPRTAAEIRNPVLRRDFPDPFLLEADGRIYAYATNSGSLRVQVSSSDDLAQWSTPRDELVRLPPWVNQQKPDVWAREVMRTNGQCSSSSWASGRRQYQAVTPAAAGYF